MKTFAIVIAVFLFVAGLVVLAAPSVKAQEEHAATVEQCRADAVAWLDKNLIPNLSYNEVADRAIEMNHCNRQAILTHDTSIVGGSGTYANETISYLYEATKRQHDYLVRHNETAQFFAEDASGLK